VTCPGWDRRRVNTVSQSYALFPFLTVSDTSSSGCATTTPARTRYGVGSALRSLRRVVGTTFASVTHDQEEALTVSDRLAVPHDERVLQVGTPATSTRKPASARVAPFPGTTNLYDATVVSLAAEGLTCRVGGPCSRSPRPSTAPGREKPSS